MKTIKFSLILLAFMAFAQTTWAQSNSTEVPCLPGHGETEDQSAWCGDVFQTIALEAGTNWVSFNVEITLADLQSALVDALPGTTMAIKGKSYGTNYNGTRWRGQLNTLDITSMYKITVTANCEITVQGAPVDPAEHPITISQGANWIAFPFASSMTVTNAFAGFALNGDNVKGKSRGTNYNGTNWRGQLTNLEPGKGYIYNSPSSETRVFTYPTAQNK